MPCDHLVRPSQRICNSTPIATPCFLSASKINIMSRKQTLRLSKNMRKTNAKLTEREPTCGLLRNYVTMCAYHFGNIFTGKCKNLFSRYCKREVKVLSYNNQIKFPVRDIGGKTSRRRVIKRRCSNEQRQKLIKNAEGKLKCLAYLHYNLKDAYSELLKENLDNSPFKDIIIRIQVILSRVAKFVNFTRGKLSALNIYTLNELIGILEEFVYTLKLISNVELKWNNPQIGSVDCSAEEKQHPCSISNDYSSEMKYQDNENHTHINCWNKENQYLSLIEKFGFRDRELKNRTKKNKSNCGNKPIIAITRNRETSISVVDSIIKICNDKLIFSQNNGKRNTFNYRENRISSTKDIKPTMKNRQKIINKTKKNRNRSLQTKEFEWGNKNLVPNKSADWNNINGSKSEKRTMDLETGYSISYYGHQANRERSTQNKLSQLYHLKTLGLTETETDKYRRERKFGKNITKMRTKVKKPNKIKLNQITKEFVKIRDTIGRLIKTTKGIKRVQTEVGPEGDVTSQYKLRVENKNKNKNKNKRQRLNNKRKEFNQFENKLKQLNKKITDVKMAYDLLQRISTNTLSRKAKRTTVIQLMSKLNSVAKEVNMFQLTFENIGKERTVVSIFPKNCESNQSKNFSEVKHNMPMKEILIDHFKNNNKKWTGGYLETGKTGDDDMQWPDLHHHPVLYNFDGDGLTCSQLLETSRKENSLETKEKSNSDDPPCEKIQKGTQTHVDIISRCLGNCNDCKLLYQDSCIITLAQPFARVESSNIITRELKKITPQKHCGRNSHSEITVAKSKHNKDNRIKLKEFFKVNRATFERSCKHGTGREGSNYYKESSVLNKKMLCSRSLSSVKGQTNSPTFTIYKFNSSSIEIQQENNGKKTENKETAFSKDKLDMKNAQTSYDSFLTKPQVMYVVEALLCEKDHCACYESQNRVKEAVRSTLAGIESAYRLALQQFTKCLNRQGININTNSSCKNVSASVSQSKRKLSTSPSLFKYAEMESNLSLYSYHWNSKPEIYLNKQMDYLPKTSVDPISFKRKIPSGSKILYQRISYPISENQLVHNKRSAQSFVNNCHNFISTFSNSCDSSTLIIQNHNFK